MQNRYTKAVHESGDISLPTCQCKLFFSQLMTLCIVQDDFVNMEHTCRYTCIEMQQECVDIQKIRKKGSVIRL